MAPTAYSQVGGSNSSSLRGSTGSSNADKDAIYIVGMIVMVAIAIQMILCLLFAYKFCKAKFRPDPPPYTPPSANTGLQQQSNDPVGPPPGYLDLDSNEETSSNAISNVVYQSTDLESVDSRAASEPSCSFASSEINEVTNSDRGGSALTLEVLPARERDEFHVANNINEITTHSREQLSFDLPASSELYLRYRNEADIGLSTNTGEFRQNSRNTTDDEEVNIDETSTPDEERVYSVSSQGASSKDINNAEGLEINITENNASWSAIQTGLENTCTKLQDLTEEKRKDLRTDLNEKTAEIDNMTVNRSSSAVA